MKYKIRIDTAKEAQKLVNITSKIDGKVTISDGTGLCVNAKSVMGVLYTMEFDELWLESEKEIYSEIMDFIME